MRPVLLIALIACTPGNEPEPSAPGPTLCPTTPDERVSDVLALLDAERETLGAPGRAVMLMVDGEVVACEGLGSARVGSEVPVGAQTRFRIGSLTKSMTALVARSLHAEGALDLDATLADAGWSMLVDAEASASITGWDLLRHTSGLVDYLLIDDDERLNAWITGTAPRQLYPMAPGGSFWNYSNPGYYFVGWMIAEATGEPYPDVMRDRLWGPVGMERTTFSVRDVAADGDYAEGLGALSGPEPEPIGPRAYDNAWAAPAGYAWSTAEDLAGYARFLMDGDDAVLADADRLDAMSSHVDTHNLPGLEGYGDGWFVLRGYLLGDRLVPDRIVQHGGDIPGFATDLYLLPSRGFAIGVMTSADGAHLGSEVLAQALETLAPSEASEAAPDWSIDPDRVAAAIGSYEDPYNVGTMRFEADGDGLSLVMPDLEEAGIPYDGEVTPILPDSYAIEIQGMPLQLTFIGEGEPRWARTRVFVAERSEDGEAVTVRRQAVTPLPEPVRHVRFPARATVVP